MDSVDPGEQIKNLVKENVLGGLNTPGIENEVPKSQTEAVSCVIGTPKSSVGTPKSESGASETPKTESQTVEQSPKTLLDKEQIKKRLQSFSLLKQGIHVSPIKKILNKSAQNKQTSFVSGEEIYDENGEKTNEKVIIKKPDRKKGPKNHDEIAKAVIDEIEALKKAEKCFYSNPFITPGVPIKTIAADNIEFEKKLEKDKKLAKTSKKHRHSGSSRSDIKMPESWQTVKEQEIDFENIRSVKDKTVNKSKRRDKDKKSSRKEDVPNISEIFDYPSKLRNSYVALSAKDDKSSEYKKYPLEIIRLTEKYPKISFCENPKKAKPAFPNRKQILQNPSTERVNIIKDFINNKIRHLEPVATIISARNWYPKDKFLHETEVIYDKPEMSYGLSVLTESYFDEQEFDNQLSDHSKMERDKSKNLVPEPEQESLTPKIKPQDQKSKTKEEGEKNSENDVSQNSTPDTNDYRSNWESDDDLINEIIAESQFSNTENYQKLETNIKKSPKSPKLDRKSAESSKKCSKTPETYKKKEKKREKSRSERGSTPEKNKKSSRTPEKNQKHKTRSKSPIKGNNSTTYRSKSREGQSYEQSKRRERSTNVRPKTRERYRTDRSKSREEYTADRSKNHEGYSVERSKSREGFSAERSKSREGFSAERSKSREGFGAVCSKSHEGFSVERSKSREGFSVERSKSREGYSAERSKSHEFQKKRSSKSSEKKLKNKKESRRNSKDDKTPKSERRDKPKKSKREKYLLENFKKGDVSFKKSKCEDLIDLREISKRFEPVKAQKEEGLSEKLDRIIRSKEKSSWSSDEEIYPSKSKTESEISKKSKKLNKRSVKNLVKIDYNDYEKYIDDSIIEEYNSKIEMPSRHKIKIEFSDFEAPNLEKPKVDSEIFSDSHTPEIHDKDEVHFTPERPKVQNEGVSNQTPSPMANLEPTPPLNKDLLQSLPPKQHLKQTPYFKEGSMQTSPLKQDLKQSPMCTDKSKQTTPLIDVLSQKTTLLNNPSIVNSPFKGFPIQTPSPKSNASHDIPNKIPPISKGVISVVTPLVGTPNHITPVQDTSKQFLPLVGTSSIKITPPETSKYIEGIPNKTPSLEEVSKETTPIGEVLNKNLPLLESSDPSKLVSEYEEFMKAVSFDSTDIFNETQSDFNEEEQSRLLKDVKEQEGPQKNENKGSQDTNDKEENQISFKFDSKKRVPKKIEDSPKKKSNTTKKLSSSDSDSDSSDSSSDSSSDTSSDDSSSDTSSDTSDSESGSSSSESDSDYSDEPDKTKTQSKTIKVKQEKLSDAETEKPKQLVIKKEKFDMFEPENPAVINKKQIFNLDEIELPTEKNLSPKSLIPTKILINQKQSEQNSPKQPILNNTNQQNSPGFIQMFSPEIATTTMLNSPKIDLNIRKRASNLILNVSPVKKMLMEESDSDQDFTDKFVKHNDTLNLKNKAQETLSVVEKPELEKLEILEMEKPQKVKEKTLKDLENKPMEKVPESQRSHDTHDRDHRSDRDRSRSDKKGSSRDRRRSYSRERDRTSKSSRDSRDVSSRKNRDSYDKSRRRSSRRYSRSPTPKREKISCRSPPPSKSNKFINQDSPNSSEFLGFKKSLADSTISDSELSRRNIYEDNFENSSYQTRLPTPDSPKRISLDDRINQVLGIEKPKAIDTVCTSGHTEYDQYGYHDNYINYHGYDQYGVHYQHQGHYQHNTGHPGYQHHQGYQHPNQQQHQQSQQTKVVQVGNVIQVVPTEQPLQNVTSQLVLPKVNVHEMPPKVVQVGNVLQIVPLSTLPTIENKNIEPVLPNNTNSNAVTNLVTVPLVEPPKITTISTAEKLLQKEKRKHDRENFRQEKLKKRQEKQKRKEMKIKLKTENMIKKALLLETSDIHAENETNEDIENIDISGESRITALPWPPATILNLNKIPSKGILVSPGFSNKQISLSNECDGESSKELKKVVKFADGICPGEGTSPSGGEDLPSPPPPTRKKIKNKKKVKVKIIRNTQQSLIAEESDEDDSLPPPPPPPGSPPPHLWPPRVKNVPQIVGGPPLNNNPQIPMQQIYPNPNLPFPPQTQPGVINYPPNFPPHHPIRHHMPVMPVHGGPPMGPQHLGPPQFHPHRPHPE